MKNNRSGQSAIISEKDYLKIRHEIKSSKFKLLFDIAWYTGERWGAIVQLMVSDVYDCKSKVKSFITFRAATRKASPGGVRLTRQVPIHDTLSDILNANKVDGIWLFPNKKNPDKHISLRASDFELRFAVAKSGLSSKGISTHSTRRTFVTKLHKAGVDLYTIQCITGHKDLSALRRYVEISPERVNNAINLI